MKGRSEVSNTSLKPIPSPAAVLELDRLYMKIGALRELPSEPQHKASYLIDFWRDLYLYNNLCPGDIPFPIIMERFIRGLTQGSIERKGNNQAALIKAFNDWIVKEETRHKLLEARNLAYPERKPIALSERSVKPISFDDYTTEELEDKVRSYKPFKGIKAVNAMLDEIEKELEKK